jgi:CRP/FNR family transcriptional regulator, cyclic AMP receptor protein
MRHGAAEGTFTLELDPRKFMAGRIIGQSRLQLASGEIIWKQGDPGEELFFVEKGWVKVSAVSKNGKEALLTLTGEGEFIGTRCFVDGYKRIGTATALGQCSLIRISKAVVIQVLLHEPDFAVTLMTSMARQALVAQKVLVDQLTVSSERRLAGLLLRLSADSGRERKKSQPILPHISQADLASMIGATRGRVNRFMNEFRRLGLIDYDRGGYVTVHKRLAKVLRNP